MMLKLMPLGGLGEIGLNMMAVEMNDTMFIIDAGLMFPEDHMLGVDYVIPDMSFVRQNRGRVAGIVLTHAHEDHIGALPYLLRELHAPVFGTPFTLGVVRHKLEEYELVHHVSLHAIHPRETLKIGCFELEFIRVNHSVVDGVAIAINTPCGTVIHTGDFKFSHTEIEGMATDVQRFASYGKKGVLALLSDRRMWRAGGSPCPTAKSERPCVKSVKPATDGRSSPCSPPISAASSKSLKLPRYVGVN